MVTDEQRARMRAALIDVGLSRKSVEGKEAWLVKHYMKWESTCGGFEKLLQCLHDAYKHKVCGIPGIYHFTQEWARRKANEIRYIQEAEKYRIDPNDPETKEWLRRQQRGRTSPQDGQAPKRVESRIVDRPLPNCGEVLSGPEQGGQGKVVGTNGNNGFIPAKRRRK